jgi:D-sedoheptulose 7-phosphate isomerase
MQTDLCHGLGIRGLVFNDPPLLTALANDNGYENAFQRLVDLWADAGDVLVAISSSGRSANILNACAAARARGVHIVSFSGFGQDNPLRSLGDLNFYVANANYGPVESAHAVLVHHLTDLVLAHLRAEENA